jgi:chromosome segregation ATPase
VEELERRRAELQAAAAPEPGAEPPAELQVALDRAADRDLARWAAELDEREAALAREAAAARALAAGASEDVAELADRRRVLAEQFAELAAARAQWQEAERATVAEMEQLAGALRRREAELDARADRVARADARRREDAYELWQLRMRLEGWQSKIVAYEMRWHTERDRAEADFARREAELIRRYSPLARDAQEDEVPLALPVPEASTELATLRDELDRMAAVLLEAELPEPPEGELPWAAEEVEVPEALPVDDATVLPFETPARAA